MKGLNTYTTPFKDLCVIRVITLAPSERGEERQERERGEKLHHLFSVLYDGGVGVSLS